MSSKLMATWRMLQQKPGGSWLFSKIIGYMIPYTGSIKPRVLFLEPGHAEVAMKDRKTVRNHLNCIHALAQMNLAEFCSGLAMTAMLGDRGRAIVTELRMTYHKKARGTLIAQCECPPFQIDDGQDLVLVANVFNIAGEKVSEGQAYWRVSPKPPSQPQT